MQKELNNLLYDTLTSFAYINLIIIVLLLSLFNLQSIQKKEVIVLGAEVDNTYWEEMVIKHPTYRDAWVELERMDKVEEIDPNFLPSGTNIKP